MRIAISLSNTVLCKCNSIQLRLSLTIRDIRAVDSFGICAIDFVVVDVLNIAYDCD